MIGIPDMCDLSPAIPSVQGKAMLVPPLSILPPRCIVCNADCNPKTDGDIHEVEAPSGTGALVGYALGGSAGGILGGMLQANSTGAARIYLHYCTCSQHRAVFRRTGRLVLIAFPILVALAILVGFLTWYPIGLAIFALGMIVVAIRTRRHEKQGGVANLIIKAVHNGLIVIEGAGEPFLASLPPIQE